MSKDRIVAVGLLTQRDLDLLGNQFTRAFPVDETPHFHALLAAIDEADASLGAAAEPDDGTAAASDSRTP